MATTLAIVGGVASAGASIYGATQAGSGGSSSGPTNDQIAGQIAGRPLGNDAIIPFLTGQQLYELGVPTDVVEENMLQQSISNVKNPRDARSFSLALNRARTLASQGNDAGAQHWASIANGIASKAGGGVTYAGGQITLNLSGQDGATIAQLRQQDAQHGDVLSNRLLALNKLNAGLAGINVPTANDINSLEQTQADYLNRQLDTTLGKQRAQITEAANLGGYSPSGQLSQLSTDELNQRQNITQNDALQRALQLIGGTTGVQSGAIAALKAALQPTFSNALQGATDQSSQNTLQSLATGSQIAIANAQAEAARNVSQANAYSQLGSTGLQSSLLGYALTRPSGTGGTG